MKTFISFLTIVFVTSLHAQFISADDFAHFGVGAAVSSATYAIVYDKTQNKKKAFWFSLATATFVGLSKEIYDEFIIDGRFDSGEVVATFAGGLAASFTINIFTGKNKEKKQLALKSSLD